MCVCVDSFGNEVLCGAFGVPKTSAGDDRQRFIIQVPFNELIDWNHISSEYKDPVHGEDLVRAAGATGQKAVFVDTYHAQATACEVLLQEDKFTPRHEEEVDFDDMQNCIVSGKFA